MEKMEYNLSITMKEIQMDYNLLLISNLKTEFDELEQDINKVFEE